jgi:hypothetical protein
MKYIFDTKVGWRTLCLVALPFMLLAAMGAGLYNGVTGAYDVFMDAWQGGLSGKGYK